MIPRRALLALLALCLAPLPAESAAPVKLAIGTGTAADFLPAFVARDKGLFAKHGLDVTLTVMPVPSLVPPALVAGSIQIGENTPPDLVLADAGGLDIVAIAGAARLVATNPKTSLVTRAGVTVTQAPDLAGKSVGVPGHNSVIDWFLRRWLLEHLVPLDKVTIVETPMAQMGDLLKGGQIDAAAAAEPLLSRIIASGAATRSVDFVSEVNPDVAGTFWAARRDWVAANAKTVAAFRAALADALAFIQANAGAAQAIEQTDLGFVDPVLPDFAVTVDPGDFDFFIKLGNQLGLVHHYLDVSQLVAATSP